MKKAIGFISSFILFFGLVCQVSAADVAKIGVIDMQKILEQSSAGKLFQKQLNDKGADIQKKLKSENDQIVEIQKAFEREKLVLTPEQIREKQRDFRIRVNDAKKMQEDYAKEMKRMQFQLLKKVESEVYVIVNEIGKAQGYLLIADRKTAGIIYRPDEIDITDQVIKKYNLTFSKKKK